MARDIPPLNQETDYTVMLSGREWLEICAAMTAAGNSMMHRGRHEYASELLDIPVKIVKQIDPAGWEATGE